MNREDLFRVLEQARSSAYRMESLRQYLVPAEADELAAWKAGRRHDFATYEPSGWLGRVAADTARGFRWYRTRIVGPPPLTTYEEFELQGLQRNAAAGEEVYVAERSWHADLEALHDDWWLFDDQILVLMYYDSEGRWLGGELGDPADLDERLRLRDLALSHAVPLAVYLAGTATT